LEAIACSAELCFQCLSPISSKLVVTACIIGRRYYLGQATYDKAMHKEEGF